MQKQAFVVTDIGYGDAGKGTTVDYLVRQANSAVVVRHNGGAQAAHNVVTPHGQHHTFAQFGSGSFVSGVQTYLSRWFLLEPISMLYEADHLASLGYGGVWQRTFVDEDALIITPWHRAANRLRELARSGERHGSVGIGVGETQSDALKDPSGVLRARHLRDPYAIAGWLHDLRQAKYLRLREELEVPRSEAAEKEWMVLTDPDLITWLCEQYAEWAKRVQIVSIDRLATLVDRQEQLIFEGAQGVLLDEAYGFHPYTTWSNTTPGNALGLLEELDYAEPVTRLGIMRAYGTRHGPGPFVTEDLQLRTKLKEYHNDTGTWQGAFRYGHLDLVAHRYALDVCGGLDELVVTGLDRLAAVKNWQVCTGYRLERVSGDAGLFFDLQPGGNVAAITPNPRRGDLQYQARLTELLLSCSPTYQTVATLNGMSDRNARENALLGMIEDVLGLPITITSHGPTAADKQTRVRVS